MKVGEIVVLPGCGVGAIEARVNMEVEGQDVDLMRIALSGSGDTVWIPANRLVDQGVRPVMDPSLIDRVMDTLSSQSAPTQRKQWNQRQRRYAQLLMSNQPVMLAQLVGELGAVDADKALSFTEKRMYRQAWDLLLGELAASAGVSLEDMAAQVCERAEIRAPQAAA